MQFNGLFYSVMVSTPDSGSGRLDSNSSRTSKENTMSGFKGELKRGKDVYHNKIRKTVKDWFFISVDGCPNSDLIVIVFTDETTTDDRGFMDIKYLHEIKRKK